MAVQWRLEGVDLHLCTVLYRTYSRYCAREDETKNERGTNALWLGKELQICPSVWAVRCPQYIPRWVVLAPGEFEHGTEYTVQYPLYGVLRTMHA